MRESPTPYRRLYSAGRDQRMEGRSSGKALHCIVAYIRLGKICTWRDVLERKDCLLSDVIGGSQDCLSRFSILFGFSTHDIAPNSR